eukprot:6965321-Alexandrium_andersonii.AAC.1
MQFPAVPQSSRSLLRFLRILRGNSLDQTAKASTSRHGARITNYTFPEEPAETDGKDLKQS